MFGVEGWKGGREGRTGGRSASRARGRIERLEMHGQPYHITSTATCVPQTNMLTSPSPAPYTQHPGHGRRRLHR